MQIKHIIELIEQFSETELSQAEASLLEEQAPQIAVPGVDEGEQLTHVIAALWCKNEMKESGSDARTAVRKYTQKVRNSISK